MNWQEARTACNSFLPGFTHALVLKNEKDSTQLLEYMAYMEARINGSFSYETDMFNYFLDRNKNVYLSKKLFISKTQKFRYLMMFC